MLAVLMHLLLVAFLWTGVSWQSVTPVAVEAEIWSPQAHQAAPPPPEPIPAPEVPEPPKPEPPKPAPPEAKVKLPQEVAQPKMAEPDIALEKEKKHKKELEKKIADEKTKAELEKKKLAEAKEIEKQKEKEKKKIAEQEQQKLATEKNRKHDEAVAEEKKKIAEEQQRKQEEALAEQRSKKRRDEDLKRNQMLAGEGVAGDAEKSSGPRTDGAYAKRVGALIKSHTILPPLNEIAGNPAVEYVIELMPDGSVRDARMVRSSGISAFDQAVRRAIERSAPFPPDPATGKVPPSLNVLHRPKDN